MNIFFHPLTFSLYVSLDLKWVSCRQHIYGSCFCIHSVSLYLLIGAFDPFTFKVIIDIYIPVDIFLIVQGFLLQIFFFSCISWLYNFDQYVSWHVSPWVYPVWDSLVFLDLGGYWLFIFPVREVFNYNLLKCLLISFLFFFFFWDP